MSAEAKTRQRALRAVTRSADGNWVPPLVDALFFTPKANRAELLAALRALSGEDAGDRYLDWVDLVSKRSEWRAPDGYVHWKANLFARIDARYKGIFGPDVAIRLRLEEVVSGGVGVEGIPALERPANVPAAAATFMADTERVFGVRVGEESRAYPVRVLSWHEMVNDWIGGEPVTLSYCTLCGSGVAHSGRLPDGSVLDFGTSGLLVRSNKLMIDRRTQSLWNNLTGDAVVGALAATNSRLTLLPVTVTTWSEWRQRNPATSVLVPDLQLAARHGYDYRAGAADRARRGVRFPAGPVSDRLAASDEILGVRHGASAMAFPVSMILAEGIVNARVGDLPVVVIAGAADAVVRVYERGQRRFRQHAEEIVDEDTNAWRLEESALVCVASAKCAGVRLPRLPSHLAFWSGWYSFFPATGVHEATGRSMER